MSRSVLDTGLHMVVGEAANLNVEFYEKNYVSMEKKSRPFGEDTQVAASWGLLKHCGQNHNQHNGSRNLSKSNTSMLHDAGDMVAMIEVFVLPPSESWRSLVSLLSRYGTCGACSTSAVMTRPKVNSDWFI